MSDEIRLNLDSMETMGMSAISSSESRLRGTAAEIQAAVAKLGTWEGKDSAGYQQYQKAWDGIFADVLHALNGLRQIVQTATENGRMTEKSNPDTFNI